MEARVLARILVPLVSENDIGLGLVGKDKRQLDGETLGENRMMEIIGVMPVPPATNPTFFAMPSTQWPPEFGPFISTVSPGSRSWRYFEIEPVSYRLTVKSKYPVVPGTDDGV